jgi:V-type H+-transporting ATPase subunit D
MLCFQRLKKVQGKKKRDAALEDEKRLKLQKEREAEPPVVAELDGTGPGDLLSSKDEDVIF